MERGLIMLVVSLVRVEIEFSTHPKDDLLNKPEKNPSSVIMINSSFNKSTDLLSITAPFRSN